MENNWEIKKTRDGIIDSCSIKFNEIEIMIHRHIHYKKDDWLCSCRGFNFSRILLKNKDIKKAQKEGLSLVRKELLKYNDIRIKIEAKILKSY